MSPRAAARGYHHGNLANALVEISLDLVERDGIEAFSLREAATKCGVAVSSAYKHYASRGELLQAVADLGFKQLAQLMEKRVAVATRGLKGKRKPETKLFELGRQYILFAVAHPQLFRLMLGPTGPKGGGSDRRPDAPARRLTRHLLDALQEVMTAYGNAGQSLEANMVIAWAIVHGFAVMVIDGVWVAKDKHALEPMIAELGQAVLRSLR